ncbi:phage portal protein [Christensenellaceae bacterium OttesenSCG-928-M15]|nr:phage portal protein [Christensenellaceae bacterium OttesenSCG-928-M15]
MNLSAFLRGNALPMEEREVIISKRFVDKDGKPIPWKIRAVTEEENRTIKDACMSRTTGKGGKVNMHFDAMKYNVRLAAASVVYPDLQDAELQKSYGVMGAEKLIGVMLTAGEAGELSTVVQETSGFDIEEEIEEAKNS